MLPANVSHPCAVFLEHLLKHACPPLPNSLTPEISNSQLMILRTPDERFENLPGYPFAPNYVEVDGMRMHYVEAGKHPTETVLMLHGEPDWSYLYRKMIPIVSKAGYRVVAPDLIGFGKSDKLPEVGDYSYQKHIDWVREFIEILDLQNITLVGQDWGGLIGLRLATEMEDRFKRIAAGNTFLPTGDVKPNEAFQSWQKYSQQVPEFPVGKIIARTCVSRIPKEVIAAYDAPFPDESYKAGARAFPILVPTSPDDPAAQPNREAWAKLKKWTKPFITHFSDSDPIMRGGEKYFQKVVPGAAGQAHTIITEAGHFLQEDKGEEWAALIVDFIQANP